MRGLLAICHLIDRTNEAIGKAATWLVLVAVLLSSGNAVIRYVLNESSNAWLEGQWYLFAAVFLLCAPYTLLRNEHIRIDILSGRLSARARTWIDLLGGVFFLMPAVLLIMMTSWPMFVDSFVRHELSSDAGGLLRWPAKLLIPLGFFLLALQGFSEIVKRAAFLAGHGPDPAQPSSHPALDSTIAEDHAA
jgi:TRAP-type mannitol/chloroaromatic compound transport system permease small subunit